MRHLLVLAAALAAAISAAHAQDAAPPPTPSQETGQDLILDLGAGVSVRPSYEGSDDYVFRPWPIITLHYLRLPFLGDFGGGPDTGLSFSPAFRIVGEREGKDELAGLDDVDTAFEAGATIAYRHGFLRGSATLRRGFGGHEGFVGELGLDALLEPTPKLSLSVGPRLGLASDRYLDSYLGISAAEAAASGLPAYDPDGGIKSVGLTAEARYALSERWSVVGEAGYDRLVGDAADSPIARLGSRHQFNAAIGLSYRFGIDYLD